MIIKDFYNVAIYCRLSRDDETQGESSSISTQKNMLSSYVQERGWRIVDYYVDDGISGTTFERGGFKRMIDDIEDGKVNMVITKDLSRLGRDYLKTGFYTECFFPENDVRYIAVNDGIDTINNDNDIAPFKNILNEMYAKDISKKIKSAYKVRIARGDYHGAFAPFGYSKDPNNKGKLMVDPESSETVRFIFDLAKQGYGAARIRTVLVEKQMLTPAAYLHKLDSKYYAKMFTGTNPTPVYAWSSGMVERILDNEIYIGNMIHYKEVSVSYKSKRRQHQPRDKWVRSENTHEPIIDRDTWDLVQERFLHRGVLPRTNPPNIFQRIVRCADCGAAMWLSTLQKNPKTGEKSQRRYFHCVTYREFGKTKCASHNTSHKALYDIVLNDIQAYARLALRHPEELLETLCDTENSQRRKMIERLNGDYKKSSDRLAEIDNLLQRLFEENVSGRMNHDNYTAMFARYQNEQTQLAAKVQNLARQLERLRESRDNSQKWIDLIAKYADLQELDAPIINELCEKIMVHNAEKVDGKRVQKIEIFYRFVGKIPTVEGEPEHEIHGSRHLCDDKSASESA